MQALIFDGAGKKRWDRTDDPRIERGGDAIVRITSSTICGTDLHILKGDVPEVRPGAVLGHEAVGVVEEIGSGVSRLKKGDRVLIPAITADGTCDFCRQGMYSHCRDGGWLFGHTIDGLQAEYARAPHADTSLYKVPEELTDEQVLFLADILPTSYECGVLNGQVKPGDTVAVVGAGPIGLAAVLLSRLYSPGLIIAIDLEESRLERARQFGADATVRGGGEDVLQRVMELTHGAGVDVAMEAVGIPATFELCADLVKPGGRVANIGVHGKPVCLHLERLWAHNITITTRLVDTVSVPQLLQLIQAGRFDPTVFATHTFPLSEVMEAYDIFSRAGETGALKVVLKN
ncbi:MAG: zinc-dependent alcohol dehydrogenase family protein [Actinomycetota bacterium]